MRYVYILESMGFPGRHYTGSTDDLRSRLKRHNAGQVGATSRYVPWQLRTYLAFDDKQKALAFEKYLKSASGRAFAKKRL